MCAVRIAFIEDNIDLTLNFHLISVAGTWPCQSVGFISACF